MPTTDPRIDAYIGRAAPFARPILEHLRELVHAQCPDAVETIKWGMPHFDYRGVLCSMAAFKGHVAFGFWKHEMVIPDAQRSNAAMGQLGRITVLTELPSDDVLCGWIRVAMALNEQSIPSRERNTRAWSELAIPADLAAALQADPAAQARFQGFAPGQQREYVEWLEAAKRPDTRSRRLAQAIAWIAEGKLRNWKYQTR